MSNIYNTRAETKCPATHTCIQCICKCTWNERDKYTIRLCVCVPHYTTTNNVIYRDCHDLVETRMITWRILKWGTRNRKSINISSRRWRHNINRLKQKQKYYRRRKTNVFFCFWFVFRYRSARGAEKRSLLYMAETTILLGCDQVVDAFDGIPFINICGTGICGVRKTKSRPLPVGPETPKDGR